MQVQGYLAGAFCIFLALESANVCRYLCDNLVRRGEVGKLEWCFEADFIHAGFYINVQRHSSNQVS